MRSGREVCHRCKRPIREEEVLVSASVDTGFGSGPRTYAYHEACQQEQVREDGARRAGYRAELEACLERSREAERERALDLAFRRCRHGDDERECPTCEEILADGREEMNRERWERAHPEEAADQEREAELDEELDEREELELELEEGRP